MSFVCCTIFQCNFHSETILVSFELFANDQGWKNDSVFSSAFGKQIVHSSLVCITNACAQSLGEMDMCQPGSKSNMCQGKVSTTEVV